MSLPLEGSVIVITGASAGIGAATALACADAGMDVVLHGRREERLREMLAEVTRRGRRGAHVVGDVREAGMSERLLETAETQFGRVDVVFANAGYGINIPFHEQPADALRQIFEVNFFAACDLVWAAARRWLEAGRGGHLLMCSSCLAKFTLPTYGAYSATKAAQNHVCRALRMDLRGRGIEVSSVHPITTRTEFFDVAEKASRAAGAGRVRAPRGTGGQSAETVARAVVRCLRKPRPEVWTSGLTRFAASAMTLWPGLMDVVGRRLIPTEKRQ